jgi:hypothetical protein
MSGRVINEGQVYDVNDPFVQGRDMFGPDGAA